MTNERKYHQELCGSCRWDIVRCSMSCVGSCEKCGNSVEGVNDVICRCTLEADENSEKCPYYEKAKDGDGK